MNNNIHFININDLSDKIRYITTVNHENFNHNIYEYTNNNTKFSVKTHFFGIIIDKQLYIINTQDTGFTEEFKNQFLFITDEYMNILNGTIRNIIIYITQIMRRFEQIENFKFVSVNQRNNENFDLTKAKEKLKILNTMLNCEDYNLSLDYVFNNKPNAEVNIYSIFEPDLLILCVFTNDNKCVSSLTLYINENHTLTVLSKTKPEFEGKKMNKLLRAIILLIANEIHPNITIIQSDAINPISAHLMINTFNGSAYDDDNNLIPKEQYDSFDKIKEYLMTKNQTDETDETDENYKKIIIRIDLNDERTILNAKTVFENIASSFCKKKTGETKSRKKKTGGTNRRKKHNTRKRKTRKYKM